MIMDRKDITRRISKALEKHINPRYDTRIYMSKEVTLDYGNLHPIRVDYMLFKPLNNTISGIAYVGVYVLDDSEMYFTTELRHLEENLENSISVFELEEGNKKYRVVNKPLDILKPGENNAAGSRLNENTKYNANMIIE